MVKFGSVTTRTGDTKIYDVLSIKLCSIYKQLRRFEFKFEFFIDVILPAKLWPCG